MNLHLLVVIIFRQVRLQKNTLINYFEKDILINGEAYISSAYDLMAKDGLEVDIYKIDFTFSMGNTRRL